jgi:hypothetical protein
MLKVVVVPARCSHGNHLLCIRMEQVAPSQWMATWAFKVREDVAMREGYDARPLEGSFGFAPGYPGCPHCESCSFYVCGCGMVVCWNGQDRVATCPSCRSTSELIDRELVIRAHGDR